MRPRTRGGVRRWSSDVNPPAVAKITAQCTMNTNTPENVNPAPAAAPRAVSPLTASKRAENKGNRETAAAVRILTACRQTLDTAAANRKGSDTAANRLAETLNREETAALFTAAESDTLRATCETLRKGIAPSREARRILADVIARAAANGEMIRLAREADTRNAADARAAENAAKSARKSRKAEILAAAAKRPLTADEVAFLSAPARKRATAAA